MRSGNFSSIVEPRGMTIKIKAKNKGKLHKALGVAEGKKISEKKIKKAEKSKSPTLRKEAQFADNAKKWKK